MIQAFSADRANQALHTTILPRRAWRGWTIANPERANAPDKYAAITRIPIVDQIAGDLLPAIGRRQLVGDPFRRWMRGNAEPQDLSPAMGHNQQPIEQPERGGRNDKQVHRRNATRMVAQERLPALGRWSRATRTPAAIRIIDGISDALRGFLPILKFPCSSCHSMTHKIGDMFMLGFRTPEIPEWLRSFASEFGLGGIILFDYDVTF